MSDRNMIGTLLIVGGLALILIPSHETAVRISAFVQEMMGVSSLAAAFIVVSVVCIMIFLGGLILIWGRR